MLESLKALGFLAVAALAVGCSSNGDGGGDGGRRGGHASHGMMCPKCETVWTAESTSTGTKVQKLSTGKGMTCPDCDAMARSQLTADGKVMLHECDMCKVTPQALHSHPAPSHTQGPR